MCAIDFLSIGSCLADHTVDADPLVFAYYNKNKQIK